MRDPRNYFVNPFDTDRITFNQVAALTTDHLGKLGNQNGGGEWTARIVATTAAMADYDDGITDNMTQGDFRKARKMAKNDFRDLLPVAVRAISNWVEAEFGGGSVELISVIGSGTGAIRDLPDDGVENYLQKVIDALTPLVPTIGQVRLDEATALKSQWDTIYAASEQSTADKRLSEEERRAAREVLVDVLFETLIAITNANRGNPDVLGNFFTPSLAGGPPISGGGGGGGPGSSSFPVSSSSFPPSSSSLSSSFSFSSSFSSSFPSSSSGP